VLVCIGDVDVDSLETGVVDQAGATWPSGKTLKR
jgi:hypothetical protein